MPVECDSVNQQNCEKKLFVVYFQRYVKIIQIDLLGTEKWLLILNTIL